MSARASAALAETREPPTKSLATWLLRTDDAWLPAILRVGLGVVMLPHGVQKTFGLGGVGGFTGTMAFFTDVLHVPSPVALLVVAIELVGAVALIVGAATRLAAAGIAAVMVGATLMVHAEHGFFMNWFGNQRGEGFEYHLLALTLATALVVAGGGRASLDRRLGVRAAG